MLSCQLFDSNDVCNQVLHKARERALNILKPYAIRETI